MFPAIMLKYNFGLHLMGCATAKTPMSLVLEFLQVQEMKGELLELHSKMDFCNKSLYSHPCYLPKQGEHYSVNPSLKKEHLKTHCSRSISCHQPKYFLCCLI